MSNRSNSGASPGRKNAIVLTIIVLSFLGGAAAYYFQTRPETQDTPEAKAIEHRANEIQKAMEAAPAKTTETPREEIERTAPRGRPGAAPKTDG